MTFDNFRGGMVGVIVGDALGAPYEFYADRKRIYSGEMELEPRIYNRYTSSFRSGVVGQITDDSEMTMITARVIASVAGRGTTPRDPRNSFLLAYLEWANNDTRMLGINTRNLFKGVSTVKGYESRVKKFGLESQSNGPLMRALPFAFLPEELGNELAIIATRLTNDNEVAIGTILTYLDLVRNLIQGIPITIDDDELYRLEDSEFRGKNKGWIKYPLLFIMQCLQKYPLEPASLPKIAENVINDYRGCDSDTVLSIVFGVYCSVIGHAKLVKYPWFRSKLELILNADTSLGGFPRPEKLWASTFYSELRDIWKSMNH